MGKSSDQPAALAALRREIEAAGNKATLVLSPFATLEEGKQFQELASAWQKRRHRLPGLLPRA